ncbi:hypothetical protein GCM10011505_14520 [Tistrella bauzanensis]|uniref:RidA family protein n=1 Tax=Tistrella bauzanensis TaxID=657419 RepID=A0ABQ1IDP8_9PROT|nr:RidA family protein [Tistrella bauzanensis]GGB34180.1 hypothetical protein GCM10011505_14520 [Tistrella bauzanensis]
MTDSNPDIRRVNPGPRMSDGVVYNGMVWLAGKVGTPGRSVAEQTADALAEVDAALERAGSDRSRILQAIIWLADINDFAEMNAVWDKWVVPGHSPARATGEAKLAAPEYRVEVIVTAAVKP